MLYGKYHMGARDGRRPWREKNGRYDRYDRDGRYGGYDALKNASHVVRLDEQSKDPKRSPESPQPMSEENQNRNRPRQALRARGRASEQNSPYVFSP